MKIFNIFSIAMLTACVACTGSSDHEHTGIYVTSSPVDFGEEVIIGNPISMARSGNLLAINDNKGDSVLIVFDIADNNYVGQFGRKGNGPGEFGHLTLISPDTQGFLISEPMAKRATAVKINSKERTATYEPVFETETSLWYLEKLANGNYLTTEGYVDYPELFKIISPEGNVVALTGDRQIPGRVSHLPAQVVTAAYQFAPFVSPDRKKVLALGSGEAAGFYKVDADTVALVSQFFNPAAEADHKFSDQNYLGQEGTVPMGFVTATASNDAVYILNSEFSIEDCMKDGAESIDYVTGKVIYVYDWDGKKIGELHTDRRLRHITAPDTSGRMYAITEDGCDPTVVVLEIPEIK